MPLKFFLSNLPLHPTCLDTSSSSMSKLVPPHHLLHPSLFNLLKTYKPYDMKYTYLLDQHQQIPNQQWVKIILFKSKPKWFSFNYPNPHVWIWMVWFYSRYWFVIYWCWSKRRCVSNPMVCRFQEDWTVEDGEDDKMTQTLT